MQRPVFYAIAIIITAYLPIFTLQRVEGRLFRPMAWTVAFALLGAMTFSILIAPVLAGMFLPQGRSGAAQSGDGVPHGTVPQAAALGRSASLGGRRRGVWLLWRGTLYLGFGGVIGAEFLPHLDEGSIWARGTLANSTSLSEGEKFTNNERYVFASFPGSEQRWCRKSAGPTMEPTPAGSATRSTSST